MTLQYRLLVFDQNMQPIAAFGYSDLSGLDYRFEGSEVERLPEPSTWLMLAGGVGLLALKRGRG